MYLRVRTTKISARICRSNTARLAGLGRKLYSVIFEIREDNEGEFYHLVTLWKATREEESLYEENS